MIKNFVSKEQIKKAKEIDLLTYLQIYEPNLIKRCGNDTYCLKEHDSLIISNGLWNWFSRGIGGKTALDFLIKVRGMDFVNAVQVLANNVTSTDIYAHSTRQDKQSPRKLFELPKKNWNNLRAIAYLQGRGIDTEIIQHCIKLGIIYESANYHNCVFVGKNMDNIIKYATLRGTGERFVQDVCGSEKKYGFSIPPRENASKSLLIFESPIDALSQATIDKQSGFQLSWNCPHRLSLGGTSLMALVQYLKDHTGITNVGICLDNDEPGQKAANKIKDLLENSNNRKYTAAILAPSTDGKDYNDLLIEQIQKKINVRSKSM